MISALRAPVRRARLVAAVAVVGTLVAPGAAFARQSTWTVELRPTLTFSTMRGDIAFAGGSTDATLDLGDLLSSMRPAFEMGVDVWYEGKWGLLTEVGAVDFEGKAATDQNAVFKTRVEETIGHVAVARRLSEQAYVTAGARFWSAALEFSVGPPNAGELDGSDDWVDPFVGGFFEIPFEAGWYGTVEADVGGFGVGSDFAWRAIAGVGYDVTRAWAVRIEYGLLGVDYTTDTASGGTVDYGTLRHGPRVGLTLFF